MNDVYIVDGIRTPIGKFLGELSEFSPKELVKVVMKEIVYRNKLQINKIDEIIVSISNQPTNETNIGRTAALELGYPQKLPAYTVNRNCGSGLQAVYNAFQSIRANESSLNLVVGVENMSQWPYLLRGARKGFKMHHQQFVDSLTESLTDPVVNLTMGETAEIVAKEWGITREQQDEFAYFSHQRAIRARENRFFENEIVPIINKAKNEKYIIAHDEGPNASISMEKLLSLKPVFKKEGTVTAGNACGLNDGAGALLVANEKVIIEHNLKVRAKIKSIAFVGLEPERMGLGPAYAVPVALKKANLLLHEIDIIELNEAFAAQSLACIKMLDLNPDNVNINGGAIAIGHPIGATGIRLLTTLINALEKENKRYGIATLCIGGGLGGAVVIEKL